ncbi:multiple sugar-binding protein [Spirochaetota bacterium]|nr:multiple sugar-binding protein [Spirochaetota bacterium]
MKKNNVYLSKIALLLITAAMFVISCGSDDTKLVINSNQSDPAPKEALRVAIEQFKSENPKIEVTLNEYDHEAYKTAIRTWLPGDPPDVVYWFAGNRMNTFVKRDLFADVSDVWQDNGLYEKMSSTKDSLTVDGKQYGVPFSYYHWGVYYRKDIFDKLGIAVPKTWDEYLAACEKLKSNGVTPVTIGTKFLWTAAGWFDYLNLRINGLAFHIDLMEGRVAYTDDRVKEVFKTWGEFIRKDYYLKDHSSYSWQEAQKFLYDGRAAMYLIGNFIVPGFPENLQSSMSYFQFPIINTNVGVFEDAPTDTLHIPSKAKNKVAAKKFLSFMAQAEVQTAYNEELKQIPPNKEASTLAGDPFLEAGLSVLSTADGTAQFYDRDSDPDMAKEGMKGFQEFMIDPSRSDDILTRLEAARERVYGSL